MAIDNRVVAILLVAGIFASMATVALYGQLTGTDAPRVQQSQTVSGFVSLNVAEDAVAPVNEQIGGDGSGTSN